MESLESGVDFPEQVGTGITLGDIRVDNVKCNSYDEYVATINIQYVGDYKITAKTEEEAIKYAESMMDSEVPEGFKNFKLERSIVYDIENQGISEWKYRENGTE